MNGGKQLVSFKILCVKKRDKNVEGGKGAKSRKLTQSTSE